MLRQRAVVRLRRLSGIIRRTLLVSLLRSFRLIVRKRVLKFRSPKNVLVRHGRRRVLPRWSPINLVLRHRLFNSARSRLIASRISRRARVYVRPSVSRRTPLVPLTVNLLFRRTTVLISRYNLLLFSSHQWRGGLLRTSLHFGYCVAQ